MADDTEPIRARIRRLYVPDAIYFITCVTRERCPLFADESAIAVLRHTLRAVKDIHVYHMRAYVFLPDHFHILIHVEPSTTISKVMHAIKRNFTLNFKRNKGLTKSLNLWQRGFWDHVIRDARDYTNHVDYIHFNPVKHGLVSRAADYQHSSFFHYLGLGWYEPDWGEVQPDVLKKMDFE